MIAPRRKYGPGGGIAHAESLVARRTPLNRQQIVGFGWMLDDMDSVIYALVLGPALTELLPRSGIEASPANIGFAGSLSFGLFLVGWGLSFIWGPIADKFGRTKVASRHGAGLCGVYGGCRICAKRLDARALSLHRRHRRGG